jgi:hypothetical protein
MLSAPASLAHAELKSLFYYRVFACTARLRGLHVCAARLVARPFFRRHVHMKGTWTTLQCTALNPDCMYCCFVLPCLCCQGFFRLSVELTYAEPSHPYLFMVAILRRRTREQVKVSQQDHSV